MRSPLSPSFSSLYDVLGVERSASVDEVRRAYRKKALETHPDKLGPSATEEDVRLAEVAFHKIQEAFDVLGDPDRRKAYDARKEAKTDPASIIEAAARRMADREVWAQKRREQSEQRIAEIRRQRAEFVKEVAALSADPEVAACAEILQEIYEATPEIEARKQAVLKRKAEREMAEIRARRPQVVRTGPLAVRPPAVRSWTA